PTGRQGGHDREILSGTSRLFGGDQPFQGGGYALSDDPSCRGGPAAIDRGLYGARRHRGSPDIGGGARAQFPRQPQVQGRARAPDVAWTDAFREQGFLDQSGLQVELISGYKFRN